MKKVNIKTAFNYGHLYSNKREKIEEVLDLIKFKNIKNINE
jgi:hypothetical protein